MSNQREIKKMEKNVTENNETKSKKPSKLKIAKKHTIRTLATLATGFGILFAHHGVEYKINKAQSEKINLALDFYGGADRYLNDYFWGTYIKFAPYNTKDIKVGVDSSVPEKTKKEIVYCVDYINDMFAVINPNYHFKVIDANTIKNCNIYVSFDNLAERFDSSFAIARAVTTNVELRNIFNCIDYAKAEIVFNSKMNKESCYDRMTFLHEMMHALLLTDDLQYGWAEKYTQYSVPFSLMSYSNYEQITVTLDRYNKYEDENLNKQVKDTFVGYTPFDLAAFASRYGDIENEQNRIDCTNLIIDAYQKYKEVFGEKKYFLKTIELNEEGYPARFDNLVVNYEQSKKVLPNTKNVGAKVEEFEMTL